MAFTPLASFTQTVSMLPDNPALTPSALKAQFDAAPNQLLTSFNNLITALKQTTIGDSGAKNMGATAISGLTGTDVQTLLESLNTSVVNATKLPTIQTPTYLNGWVDSNNATSPGQYWKNPDGLVTFNFAIKNGATGINNSIIQFPTGYKPGSGLTFFGHVDNGGTSEAAIFTVDTTGLLKNIRTLPANGLLILNGSYQAVS